MQRLPSDDATVMALEAEILRQRGHQAEAKSQAARLATAGPDRSTAGLLLAQLWRPMRAKEAELALTWAARAPGACQTAAAGLEVGQLVGRGKPTPAAREAVSRYAQLLTQAPGPPCLVPDVTELPRPAAREA
jgi:hypothetical protein